MSVPIGRDRSRNVPWGLSDIFGGGSDILVSNGDAQLAVLMDIRDELQQLNRVFACPNAQAIPQLLAAIKANTTKPKARKRA